ncbi:epidermal growth factor receptor kinase substrate 8 isoform X2 [Hydra vulgaris]|uniref:epidermal growth factor receptor kinase substrate 8 isoform X2 n=1 Tax=Hydra vulgaris TaxID=6087 RepID=UPI001F5F15C6|nr:epidermal growth factor receptor kinase substrate 8-like isoform X2 [Hydra vulgaris]
MVLNPVALEKQNNIDENAKFCHDEVLNKQNSNYMNILSDEKGATESIFNQGGSPYSGGMENQSLRFLVEHLASFPQDTDIGYLTPDDALNKLKKINSNGGLWAQKMNMTISNEKIIMTNAQTMELIEEYPAEQVSLCISILDDPNFENLLVFSTRPTREKSGAVHIFQSKTLEVNMITDAINRSREIKAQMLNRPIQNGKDVLHETKTYDLQQKHAVAQAVQAFQYNHVNEPFAQTSNDINGNGIKLTPLQDAKISRDVEILNHCIEEVERFVVMLKRINEARKQLQTKKKSSKKKKENILILQAQPPPEHRVYDIFQKFKHSLNLLAKLKPHISNPNSTELIHYLFIPLGIIVKVTGLEKARAVVDPLLTQKSVEFLNFCLDSREYHFWQSLGPNWTLTKTAPLFMNQVLKHYTPIFEDGWIPPELVINEKLEPATHATSLAITRMKADSKNNLLMNSAVLKAALQFKKSLVQRSVSSDGFPDLKKSQDFQVNQPQRNNSYDASIPVKPKLFGIVIYDYLAHNNKELTIRAGERVTILDNSRRWWLVRNNNGEQGYVPSTVLEIPIDSDQSSDTSSNRSTPLQSPTGLPKKGSSFGLNQNYVNSDSLSFAPTHSVTPVVISVQLPEGKGANNQYAKQISIQTQISPHQGKSQNQPSPLNTGQSKPSPVYTTQLSAPPAPPPPTAFGPPKSITIPREANLQYQHQTSNQPDLHIELKEKLSLHQLRDDLNVEKRAMDSYKQNNAQTAYDFSIDARSDISISDLDSVDVFIPLYKSSTADDVSRWLHKLGFSDRTIDILRGKTALELFKINKEDLVDLIGKDEGSQLHEELQVQNGAKTRHKTLTEFQKALVRRMQNREGDGKSRVSNVVEPTGVFLPDPSKADEATKHSSDEQLQNIRRRQQEEITNKNPRSPDSATFSSFTQNKYS